MRATPQECLGVYLAYLIFGIVYLIFDLAYLVLGMVDLAFGVVWVWCVWHLVWCIFIVYLGLCICYSIWCIWSLVFGMVDSAGTIQIVTPALVTLPLIFELLRVNCRDLLSL